MNQEYSKRFYSVVAPAYDWVFGRTLDGGRRAAALLVRADDRVLELGVGTGLGLRHYPPGCLVTGVDICPAMLRKARLRALLEGNGTPAELRCMDATRLTFADGTFDVVVAPYVLTTVGDPLKLCLEARRVCRRGGRVIVLSNTREGGLWGQFKEFLSPFMERVGFSTHLDVAALLGAAGLEVADVRRVNLGIHRLFVAHPR